MVSYQLLHETLSPHLFTHRFNREPRWVAQAPGRRGHLHTHAPVRAQKYLAKSTGPGVGHSPCGGWVGSRSWILNQVNIQMQPHKLQPGTSLPPPVPNTSSDMLSELLSAFIHQWTAWHWIRQNGSTEHDVHTESPAVENNNMLFHPLLPLLLLHSIICYYPYRLFYNIRQRHGKKLLTFIVCIFSLVGYTLRLHLTINTELQSQLVNSSWDKSPSVHGFLM